jgi:hypothetical protein
MKMEAKKWTYEAIRQNGIVTATIKLEVEPGYVEYFPLHHFVLHSPSGFEMGFGGSGPADLAYSILIHWFLSYKFSIEEAKEEAASLYQEFKRAFVAKESERLIITDSDIENWWVSQEIVPEAAK